MAITLRQKNIVLNPTKGYIPMKENNALFVDSILNQTGSEDNPVLQTTVAALNVGLKIAVSESTLRAALGDFENSLNGTSITVDDDNQQIVLSGNIEQNGGVVTPTTKYLKLNINGTNYLLPLSQ